MNCCIGLQISLVLLGVSSLVSISQHSLVAELMAVALQVSQATVFSSRWFYHGIHVISAVAVS